MKWSPTSIFACRTHGPENLYSARQNEFCNTIGQYRQSRDIRSPHRRRRAGLADGKVQRLGGAKIKFQIEFELSHTALLSAVRFVRLAWRLALAGRAAATSCSRPAALSCARDFCNSAGLSVACFIWPSQALSGPRHPAVLRRAPARG